MGWDVWASLSETGDNVHDSCGNTCLVEDATQHQGCEWSLFGWFEHDSASSSQSRGYFPGHHQQGIVPRNNLANHSNWLFNSHSEHWTEQLESASFYFVSLASEVSIDVGSKGNVLFNTSFKGFSIIDRFIVGKPFDILFNKVSNFVKNLSFLVGIGISPNIIESFWGRFNSMIDIFFRACNSLSNHLFCCGVNNIK